MYKDILNIIIVIGILVWIANRLLSTKAAVKYTARRLLRAYKTLSNDEKPGHEERQAIYLKIAQTRDEINRSEEEAQKTIKLACTLRSEIDGINEINLVWLVVAICAEEYQILKKEKLIKTHRIVRNIIDESL